MLRNWLSRLLRRATPSLPQSEVCRPDGPACIIDLDNLLNDADRGDVHWFWWARIDFEKFGHALTGRGVGAFRTVYRNAPFPLHYEKLWCDHGFQPITVGTNCDPHVIQAALKSVQSGHREIILVSGDGGYTRVVKQMRAAGVWVEVWSRRHKTAEALARAANSVRYIDDLVLRGAVPRRRQTTAVTRRPAAASSFARRTP